MAHTPSRVSRIAANRFDRIEDFLQQVARRDYAPRCIVDGGAALMSAGSRSAPGLANKRGHKQYRHRLRCAKAWR
jgi:hypothetical protein